MPIQARYYRQRSAETDRGLLNSRLLERPRPHGWPAPGGDRRQVRLGWIPRCQSQGQLDGEIHSLFG